MQDRIPLYPGRVKLTPVAGQENTYDMVRADSPTQEGTPLSKATLLTDATAALFGLGSSAVPNDVLEKIKALVDAVNANAGARARFQLTSYVGTGASGESGACSVSFDFPPVFVAIYASRKLTSNEIQSSITTGICCFADLNKFTTDYQRFSPFCTANSGDSYGKKSDDGKTIMWYNTTNSYQYNSSTYEYFLFAIG